MQAKFDIEDYEVLTPTGWQDFSGLIVTTQMSLMEIHVDNVSLKCTPNHKIKTRLGWVEASELNVGDEIITSMRSSHITSIRKLDGTHTVFDLSDVANGHEYFTNDIVSHNCNLLVLDEFAHLGTRLADEFMASVFPTISSGEKSKLVIISTPKGMNHYYKLWTEAETNGFSTYRAHWYEHPKRNQAWADNERATLGELKWKQEGLCTFLGSSASLIDGEKIGTIPHIQPIAQPIPFLNQFQRPQEKHSYVIVVDVSRGVDLDYSAFCVIDISVLPYTVVAVYRNNMVSTLVFPEIIYKVAKWYNDAYVLVETNDLGQQVADILFYDLEYENMYMSSNDKIKEGGESKLLPGMKTTKRTKTIGCDLFKNIIEGDNMIVNDMAIINEMSTFSRKGTSFAAEEGKNDDLIMTLVLFAYLTGQPVFKDLFDENLREKFVSSQIREVESQFLPIGFFDNGNTAVSVEDDEHPFKVFIGPDGEKKSHWDLVWTAVD
jgi:hypothetical protein